MHQASKPAQLEDRSFCRVGVPIVVVVLVTVVLTGVGSRRSIGSWVVLGSVTIVLVVRITIVLASVSSRIGSSIHRASGLT